MKTPGRDVGDELLVAAQGVQTKREYPKDWSTMGDKKDLLGHWVFKDDGTASGQPLTISVQLSKKDKPSNEAGLFKMAIVERIAGDYTDNIHYGLIEHFGDDYDHVLNHISRETVGEALDDLHECYQAERNENTAATK